MCTAMMFAYLIVTWRSDGPDMGVQANRDQRLGPKHSRTCKKLTQTMIDPLI